MKLRLPEKIAIAVVWVFGLIFGLCVGMPRDEYAAVQAHIYADNVLYPRLNAALNDFAFRHPQGDDHVKRLDAGDVKRWHLVREAFRDLDERYKAAGY